MPELRTVRVAAAQATPAIRDAEASIAKAVELIERAAAALGELVVLPETFVPLYPSQAWAAPAAGFNGWDQPWQGLWENSVDVPGPLVAGPGQGLRRGRGHCAIGVNERESERPGSLYNTLILVGPEGVAWKHRKLMPTHHERLFHGIGAGRAPAAPPPP